ncbi:MAG: flagellar filament capping protein FliD [Alphaproteobacteria bacterium]|uniref:Flagellar hook-associated protein 2 n=1 Tax=Candidatus Nitrobium versatile TaxID=2884831 RepID=A0A953J812_9BACT|nr:flagellar filament capping protein FliD [Candidatus Nitrobium versatile]
MGISSSGLISGLNVNDLVSQLINLEKQPIVLLQKKQKDYEVKIASVLDIKAKLSSLKSASETLNSDSQFNTKSASITKNSSGVELMTVSATNTAETGSHTVQVSQLATANKKGSQGWVDENTTAIASGTGSFKFRVGSGGSETSISVTNSTTLMGLRDAINSANSGVTASILNDGTGSSPYRLVLTAKESGSANSISITQNDTSLDFSNKTIEEAYAYTTNSYTGTAASGGTYTGTTNKTVLIEIVSGGTPASGTAAYKYSTDGGITWKGANGDTYTSTGVTISADDTLQNIDGKADGVTGTEGVKIKFTGGTLSSGERFSIDVFNPEMQAAQDAVITVDGTTITKSTNSISDVITGVTMNLLKADSSSSLSLTVSQDYSGAQKAVESFIAAYNSVNKFLNDQLSYDPKVKKANPLLGDFTIMEIRKKLGDIITSRIPGVSSGSYLGLSSIGVTSDKKTGKLTVDSAKLSDALSDNPDAVARLFIGTGTPSNASIRYIGKTSATQAGTYSININTAPEKATLLGSSTITSLPTGEELTFTYSENHTESSPTYTYFSVTYSAGATINTVVNNLNSTFATQNAKLSASNEGGKLRITATEYGADIYFKVVNDRIVTSPDSLSGGQIGFYSSVDSAESKDEGADIAGSINNHAANGEGNVLTANSGYAEDGLSISTTSTQTGGFGTIAVSSGVAERLVTTLEAYTNATSGILSSKEESLQTSVDSIKEQQERIEERLINKEIALREKFTRLEVLLGKLNAQSQYITNQLAALSASAKK